MEECSLLVLKYEGTEEILKSHRSRRLELLCKCEKGVLGNFTKFTGKHLYQSLVYNKVAGPDLQLYQKRDSNTGVSL